jgi:hypothetical protein
MDLQQARAAIIVIFLTVLIPEYRYNTKAGYAKPTIRYKLDAKKYSEHCHANTACYRYGLTDPSLASHASPLLVAHQYAG